MLDNARYQKCRKVTELAEALGTELVYLPPYSPNLNLIERVWKLVKSELRLKYYGDFETFRNRIDDIIRRLWTTYAAQTANLLGKVQLSDDLVPINNDTYQTARTSRNSA